MSVQPFQQQSKYKENLWIDIGTNISAKERSFKTIEKSERFANMTVFANDLVKNNVLIGFDPTCCMNNSNSFQIMFGLPETPYLKNNEGFLLLRHYFLDQHAVHQGHAP
eukprot:821441-Ditylum_brightwellii.AAC.1